MTGMGSENELVSISFWKTRQDAEAYHQNTYPRLIALLTPHITHPPTVRNYDVVTSTIHKIAAGKAA
jgi:hypothetical protein